MYFNPISINKLTKNSHWKAGHLMTRLCLFGARCVKPRQIYPVYYYWWWSSTGTKVKCPMWYTPFNAYTLKNIYITHTGVSLLVNWFSYLLPLKHHLFHFHIGLSHTYLWLYIFKLMLKWNLILTFKAPNLICLKPKHRN